MAKTAITREETTTELPRLSLVVGEDFDWLTEELKTDLSEGLAIVTKLDSGEEFTEWNNWIATVAKTIPELKDHLTVRKTKKGIKYYGLNRKLYQAVKDSGSSEGLPAL